MIGKRRKRLEERAVDFIPRQLTPLVDGGSSAASRRSPCAKGEEGGSVPGCRRRKYVTTDFRYTDRLDDECFSGNNRVDEPYPPGLRTEK